MNLAEFTKNPQLCEYIIGGSNYVNGLDGWGRDYCVSRTAVLAGNLSLCNTIKDNETEQACLDNFNNPKYSID